MTDKTPPAWAINAARTIVGFWTTASALPLSVREQKTATVISNFAPDAEALAVALEEAIETIKAWHEIKNSKAAPDAWDIYYNHAPEMKSILAAIAAYRAQHPKG